MTPVSHQGFTPRESDWIACFAIGEDVDGEFRIMDGPFDTEDGLSPICWVIATDARRPPGPDNQLKIHLRKDFPPEVGDALHQVKKLSKAGVQDLYVAILKK